MCYQRENARANWKNLSVAPTLKRSTRIDCCNTNYMTQPSKIYCNLVLKNSKLLLAIPQLISLL